MDYVTKVTLTNAWQYVPDLVVNARIADGQIPLPQMTGIKIIFKAQDAGVLLTNDPTSTGNGIPLPANEIGHMEEGFGGAGKSLRVWFAKGAAGGEDLEITVQM